MFRVGCVSFGLSLVICVIATWIMKRMAPRLGLVDVPAERKVHHTPKPLGGGVAIWLGVILTVATAYVSARIAPHSDWLANMVGPEALRHIAGMLNREGMVWLILGMGTLIMLMGLIDDRRGLSPFLRLFVQIGLVSILIWQDIRMTLIPPFSHYWISCAVTIIWVVGLTNAFNFLDNMDGLSGGIAWISAGMFCIFMVLIGSHFIAGFLLIIMGALLGFLFFNWHPASIFMGDAGSNFIGFLLGVITVVATFTQQPELPEITIAAPLCVLAVPIYDSTTVICIRLGNGKSPFEPDKNHFSHRLVALGMSTRQAVLTIYLVALATGLGALSLYPLSNQHPGLAAMVVIGQITCLLGVIAILEAAARKGDR